MFLVQATSAAVLYLAYSPQREIAPYISCLTRGMSGHGGDKLDPAGKRAALVVTRNICGEVRQKSIAAVEEEGGRTSTPVAHDRALALADAVDRAFDRIVSEAVDQSGEQALQILDDEAKRAFNR